MKIVIVGSNAIWAIENYYALHLRELGAQVLLFNCTDYFQPRALVNRVLNRLGMRSFYKKVNQVLLEYCLQEKPDIIWVFKGIEIFPKTLKRLKQDGFILVNYNPDHPFIRTALSHGGKSVETSVKLYDAHFCYSESLTLQIQNDYGIKTFLLPFGFEPTDIHHKDVGHSKDILRVCMVGNADKIRATYVKALVDHGIPVDVYGGSWGRFLNHSDQCRIYSFIFGDKFWEILLDYRVQLNVFRPHNEGSHNMRSFEIPSIGGIQLAPYSIEHARFFKEGREIWLYSSVEEMIRKARFLLEAAPEDIIGFRNEAKGTCHREEYTYQHRALQALNAFSSLLK